MVRHDNRTAAWGYIRSSNAEEVYEFAQVKLDSYYNRSPPRFSSVFTQSFRLVGAVWWRVAAGPRADDQWREGREGDNIASVGAGKYIMISLNICHTRRCWKRNCRQQTWAGEGVTSVLRERVSMSFFIISQAVYVLLQLGFITVCPQETASHSSTRFLSRFLRN